MQREGESDADYAARAVQALEDKLVEIGPDRVIAFVAETVVGATAGVVPPVGDYFKRIRAICDRYGVLLILDEVMCGMGRTGTLHACEQEGVAPDLMAIAKGLGGGYQPIGAVMLTQRIYEAFANGSGAFQHGHTYMGHPMAAAAALAVQDGRIGFYNRAYLVSANGQGEVDAHYDKIELVPFGEYVPARAILGFFVNKVVNGMGDLIPGKEQTLFDFKGAKLGILICYESIFPDLTRREVNEGADVLVNITNDAWYGESSAPYQVLAMAAMRSSWP